MENWLFEITDLMAIAIVHCGSYLKIRKKSIGWLFSLFAISYFIMRAIHIGLYSQCLGHAISFSLALYGFLQWRYVEKARASGGYDLESFIRSEMIAFRENPAYFGQAVDNICEVVKAKNG